MRKTRAERPATKTEKIYCRLRWLYPADYRRKYAAEMEQLYRDLCREALETQGGGGLFRLWLFIVKDLSKSVVTEQAASLRGGLSEMQKNKSLGRAVLGLLALAPAFIFTLVASSVEWAPNNVFYNQFDAFLARPLSRHAFNLVSPPLFLGGLVLAIILNLYPFVRLDLRNYEIVISLGQIKRNIVNFVVVGTSSLIFAVLLGYAILENGG